MHPPTPRAGFTLLELLVVISIIALMTGTLLPVLGGARKSAQAVKCLGTQRQLGLAAGMYLGDHRFHYPRPMIGNATADFSLTQRSSGFWFNAVDYYLNLLAPSTTAAADRNYVEYKQDPAWASFPSTARQNNRTLKMNDHFGEDDRFHRESEMRLASQVVMFVDGRGYDQTGNAAPTSISIEARFDATEGIVALRHDDAANVTFADGHAGRVKQAINTTLAFPGWFTEAVGPQELVWDFTPSP